MLSAIEPQYLGPEPMTVYRDVTDWLRANCRGIVLLAHEPFEAARILCQCRTIQAEDETHAAELRRLLVPPLPRWPVVTLRPRREAQR